jgi:hypothetical protein
MEYRKGLAFDEFSPKWSGSAVRWATALLTAFVLLLFATPAVGSTSAYFSPATASFSLRAGNGYRIAVERTRARVTLTAFHGSKSGFASTSYTVRGKVSPQRVDAHFGKFGRVSVRLRTGRIRRGKLEEQCTGKPETVRFGVFVGTIRFRGEGGYTEVAARRAQGRLSSGTRIRCVFPNLRPDSGPRAQGLHRVPPSLGAAQGRHRAFGVEISGGKRRSILFSAFSQERRGRIEVFRNVFAKGPLASFDFTDDLSSATVRPPTPFQGEASFQRTPAGPTWSGTLSVNFPGREDVRLAGPRFESQLARDSSGGTFFSVSG